MNSPTNFELDLIQEDALFLTQMFLELSKEKHSSILFPSLIPYLSLFTIESYQYFQAYSPTIALKLSSHEEIIRRSRMCIKFFEDKNKQIDEIFDTLNWIIRFYENYHVKNHTGLLAPLKKLLQTDLGLFFYEHHLFGSNYTGLFNMGFSEHDLPKNQNEISSVLKNLNFSVAYELGTYAAGVLNALGTDLAKKEVAFFDYRLESDSLGYVDKKSKNFLTTIFNGPQNIQLNLTLLIFLTQSMFLSRMLEMLTNSPSYSSFKFRYLTVYHLYTSLKRLQNYSYPRNLLTNSSKAFLQEIIGNQEIKWLVKDQKFRNILVHYALQDFSETHLSAQIPLFGLVEYFYDGASFVDIASQVNQQLTRVCDLLEEWLSWEVKPHQIRHW